MLFNVRSKKKYLYPTITEYTFEYPFEHLVQMFFLFDLTINNVHIIMLLPAAI